MNNFYKRALLQGFLVFVLSDFSASGQVVINEICPTNVSIIQNSNGNYDDWIELHNAGASTVNLNGYGLSDDSTKKFRFQFPSYSLASGKRVLVFTSDSTSEIIADHWEMGIDAATSWKYAAGSAGMDTNWRNQSFNSASWASGNGGIGFGDGDDATTIGIGVSVMMRKTFNIPDTSEILKAVLMIDYDDGFVAYLNGVEIARSNLGIAGIRPLWNTLALSSHEAQRYQGLPIDSFFIPPALFKSLLKPTNNVLAIEMHNTPANSNDMTSIPYLFFGMKSPGSTFSAIPSWFHPPVKDYFNAHFKMNRYGETIYLTNPSGTIVDLKAYPAMQSDNSYCRKPDGSSNWCFVSLPTPGASNNTSTCYNGYAFDPVFSLSGGYYSSTHTLTLSTSTPGGVIRYTTNGNTPTTTSPAYSSPITISSTKVIRAKVFASGYLPSNVITNTYIINGSTHLPTFSITTDSLNLWDWNTGIYVMGPNASPTTPYQGANFWQDWEKLASIEYYDKNKNLVVRFDGTIKIYGNYSRAKPQKSFEIKLSDRYGTGSFTYPMYSDKSYVDNVDDIVLRNSGTDWNIVHFRDAMMERILKTTNTGYLAAEPTIAYLNGSYWGVYCIDENHDHHWMKNNLGLSKGDIDYLKEAGSNIQIQDGSDATFWDLYNYATTQSPATQAYYDHINTLLDLKNYADYFSAETFYNNGDWIGDWTNNIQLWRPNAAGSKWRYFIYDLDFGLGLQNPVTDDRLAIARNPTAFSYSSVMFNAILNNPTYKRYFINRYADLMNTIFLPSNINAVMHSFKDSMAFDMVNHFAKWGSSVTTWNSNITSMMNFANARPAIMRTDINSDFGLSGQVTLTLNTSPAGSGRIEISTITPTSYPWSGIYFNGNPVTITAIPNPGYTFNHWHSNVAITTNNPNQSVTYNFTANDAITAFFTGSSVAAQLCVSELNYNSDSAHDAGDWIELHNFGSTSLDLSGWKLSDGNDNHMFSLPTGTVIAANGYLVLSEDTVKFNTQFPNVHNRIGPIGFNFSNGGDQVRLFNYQNVLYLSFYYQDFAPWPLLPDGQGYTCELTANTANPNDGNSWFAGCIGGSPGQAYSPILAIPVSISGNTTFCTGGSATLNATYHPGYIYQWRRNAINIPGATDSLYSATQSGAYSVWVSYQGCSIISPATNITVVTQQPVPQTTSAYRCGPGSISLLASASDSVFWYDASVGGNQVGIGDSLNLNNITQTTTYYARTGRTCQSNSVATVAGITSLAASPVSSDLILCGPGTATLNATDTATIRWYNAVSGGALLQTGPSFTTNVLNNDTSFFIEAGSVCPSPRIEVHVTFNTTPVPTAIDGSRCGPGIVTLNSTSPSPMTWYSSQTGGSSIGTGASFTTPSLAHSDTFYVEANSGCASPRVACIAIVNPIPANPTAADSAICSSGSVTLVANSSEQVNWYDAPSGGNLIYTGSIFVTPSISTTTTYYAVAGYTCQSARVPVQAIVSSPAAPPTSSDVPRCGNGTVTLTASSPELIYWFNQPTGGTLLAVSSTFVTPSLTSTTTYYAEAGTYCRSLTRTVVQAIINPLPTTPVSSNVSRCGLGTVTLNATSNQVMNWYSGPTGGTSLGSGTSFTTPSLSTTTTYYIEAGTVCLSSRTAVQAIISQQPAAPVVTNGSHCGTGTINLSATSTVPVTWYDAPSGGNIVGTGLNFTTPTIGSTTTYYAQADNGCSSTRSAAVATINNIPSVPVTANVSRCGAGTVTFSATSPEQIYWFTAVSGGSPVSTGGSYTTPSISTTTTYYVETGNVCRSSRISVQAVITPLPSSPVLTSGSNCGPGTVALSATSSSQVNWYSVSTGGSSIGTGLSFNTPSISSTTTYYADATSAGCTSTRVPVQAVIINSPAAPVTTGNSRCGPGTLTVTAASSTTVNWYTTASGGSAVGSGLSFTTPSISTTTTYYAEANNGCSSATRSSVQAVINPIPSAPVTANVSSCGTGPVTLSATSPEQIYWYTVASGGTSVGTGSTYITPSISTTTTYYVETGNTCRSVRISVQAVILSSLPSPVLTGGSNCGTGTVSLSASSSTQVNWFDVPTGGTSLGTGLNFTTPVISSTTTYYAESSNSQCTSPRVSVQAVINTTPAPPVTTNSSRCGPGTLTVSATSSATVKWYSASTGGSSLGTGLSFTTPSISTTTTYYAEANNGCASTRTSVQAIVNPIPAAPVTANVSQCGTGPVTLTASSPEQIFWYTVPSGGTSVGSGTTYTTPSISTTTTYYVETGNTCRSVRISVQAIILSALPAPVLTGGSNCGTGTVSLSATSSSQVDWYDVPTGGTSLGTGLNFTTPVISATTTYYAEASNSQCTSPRVSVQAVINTSPAPPVTTNSSRCGPGTITVTATSSATVKWYSASTGGSSLGTGLSFTTPSISTTTTYYAEANNGCSSTRTAVQAIVNPVPAAPASSNVTQCGAGSVTFTATAPEQIYWYAIASGGSSIGTGPTYTTPFISSTTTYYTEDGNLCRSLRIPVQAVILSSLPPPVLSSGSSCGTGTVNLSATSSTQVDWYDVPSGGSSLGTGLSFTTPSISSTTTYYAESSNSGCVSTRVPVQAVINTIPSPPVATGNSRCGTGSVILTATSSATVRWYIASTGGISIGQGLSFTTPSINNTTTYYAETYDGCSSARVPVQAVINSAPSAPVALNVTQCGAGSVTLTATATEQIYWYTASSGGSSVATGTSFTTPSISATTTYYVEDGNSCRSNRIAVQAIINSVPPVPTLTGGSRCGTGTINLTASSAAQVNWYSVSSGGISLGSGLSFNTPSISATTTYYADAGAAGCTSARVPVQAIINAIPAAPVSTNSSRCGPGSVSLSATAGGQIYWYTTASGGSPVDSGITFNTPVISTTKNYYVSTSNGTCTSSRVHVQAIITAIPAPPTANDVSRCGSGIITLIASSLQPIFWYDSASGGNLLFTGASFTTPSLSASTTFYVETGNTCRSQRIPVHALIVSAPNPPAVVDSFRCGPGTVVVRAISSLPVSWYSSQTGGTLLDTGLYFTTPLINSTTTYYAEAGIGCNSVRVPVVANITALPSPPVVTDTTRCGPGILTLHATSTENLYWYDANTGGNLIGTGSTFTTSSITFTTTFYVEAGNNCRSNRVPIHAIIGGSQVSSVNNASRCGPGSVVLSAVPPQSTDSLLWYDNVGGNLVGTGLSFYTPFLSHSMTFYVVDSSVCTGAPYAVTAEIFPLPIVNLGPDTVTIQSGQSDTLNAGNGFSSYEWSTSETTSQIIVNTQGLYSVTITDSNGCLGYDQVFIRIITGVDPVKGNVFLQVFPNPAHDQITVVMSETSAKTLLLKLVSADGKIIRREEIKSTNSLFSKTMSLSGIAAGVYFLELENETYSTTMKVIVQ